MAAALRDDVRRAGQSMTPLFNKLNLKDHKTVHVVGAPPSFEPELAALHGVKIVRKAVGPIGFGLVFAISQVELDARAAALIRAVQGDAVLWFAYPKGTSKTYRCDFNRDSGWSTLGAAGYEPVSQVSIDADWSALRFRKAEHIKTMKRNPLGALSVLGRHKASAR